MRQPHEPDVRFRIDGPGELGELRTELHRLRVQLALVEVLYLRLIALQARRLADPDLDHELAPEVLRLETELALARQELERLGASLPGQRFPEDPPAN